MTPAQPFAAIESNDLATVARALAPTPPPVRCTRCHEEHDDSARGRALCDAASAALDYDHMESGWRSVESRRLAKAYQTAYIAYVTARRGEG